MMWKLGVAALVCALGSLAGSATAYRPGDEVCTLSTSNQCAVDTIKPSARDGSVLIYPGGKTRCAFDDYAEADGRYKTNKTFFFQVFPNKQQEKTKLLVVFQGGGACIDTDTCSFSLQCAIGSGTFNPNADAISSGVLNVTNPDNLFKDWNIVHVPYCTGDLHVGNAVHAPVDGVFAAVLGQPQCLGKNQTMHMAGYENSIAALKWALANYPKPEHLIIGGASAGSLAVQALSAYVAEMWNITATSGIRYSVVGDSYIGVFPEETRTAGSVVEFYGSCDVDLKLPADIVAACKAKTMSVVQLMSTLLKAVPFSDWIFINSKADRTQRYFYQLMKDGILGYPFKDLISGDAFYKQATTMLTAYRSVSSRIATFFAEGETHVFMAYEGYTKVVSDSGDKLGDFLTKSLQLAQGAAAAPASTAAPAASSPSPTSSAAPQRVHEVVTLSAAIAVLVLAAASNV